tara:strand:- start:93 stop:680 length:588 start_codon:yes stop_codon:yes gene_type:complete
MNKSMSNNSNISVNDFKEFYLAQSKPRSIRRLHKILKDKYPRRKLISLATIFRHSNSENWRSACEVVDSRVSEKILEKNVNAKVKEYDNITAQLESTSNKALESVLDAFNKGIASEIKKPEQILSLVKSAVESQKLKNTLQGIPSTISGHISYDNEDIAKLKSHINELYQSINMDLMQRQGKELGELEIRKKKLN